MKYPHSDHRIGEIVAKSKCLRENERFEVKGSGAAGGSFDVRLDLVDGPFVDLRYLGKACDYAFVERSEASLILEAYRVRGVGHNAVAKRRFYSEVIPAGWHQNVLNPNLPTGHEDFNKHLPLPGFAPVDFDDFIHKTCELWKIDLAWGDRLL